MNAQLMQPGAAGGPALATSPRWHETPLWSQHSCLHMRMKRSNWREGDRETGRGKGLGFCWTVVVPPEQQSSASHRVCQLDSVALTPRAAKLYPPLSSPSQLTHNITFSYSSVCVCVFLCLSPLCVFLKQAFQLLLGGQLTPMFSAASFPHLHFSLLTHYPFPNFCKLPISPNLSSSLSSLLSSPPTKNPSRNPLLQESFQQHYFHNTQQKTKPKQNQKQKQRTHYWNPRPWRCNPSLCSHTKKLPKHTNSHTPHPKHTHTHTHTHTQNKTTQNQTNPLKTQNLHKNNNNNNNNNNINNNTNSCSWKLFLSSSSSSSFVLLLLLLLLLLLHTYSNETHETTTTTTMTNINN